MDSVLNSRYLQGSFGSRMLAPIRVIGGRQRKATAMNFLSTISMPKWYEDKMIVLHETSHILAARYYGED